MGLLLTPWGANRAVAAKAKSKVARGRFDEIEAAAADDHAGDDLVHHNGNTKTLQSLG
jgi:hypothetical protein